MPLLEGSFVESRHKPPERLHFPSQPASAKNRMPTDEPCSTA